MNLDKHYNHLLKWKMHIQKLEYERDIAQQESSKLKEKVRSLSQRIAYEKRGFWEAIK